MVFSLVLLVCTSVSAQQTLGGITGTVTDSTGALVSGASVELHGTGNGITLTTKSKGNGTYQFQNLPVGDYALTFSQPGFETSRVPSVPVQENRTGTINMKLQSGSVSTTIEVNEKPLLDTTDATNGYVMDATEIQETPLATGSFTRLAVLTPGVSAELLGGIGTNAGLGNAPIWANGQRDTSNGFQVNGVDVTNLFNGKSSSQDQSQRYNFNIGQGSSTAGQSQTNTSVYGSNGNGLATPPPEFIQELRVNTSQYDAQQGGHSGAQIDVNTAVGGNQIHGQAFGNRATNFINAAPYFNKQGVLYQNNLPSQFLVPQLHHDIIGATVSGPIIKNKLFLFLGYENQHVADELKGYSTLTVPYDATTGLGLTDDRSNAGILNAITAYNNVSTSAAVKGTATTFNGTFDPVAVALLQAKLNNGQYLIPSVQNKTASANAGTNVFLNDGSLLKANEATAALDYNLTNRDRLSAKYYYQLSPGISPFTNANTTGFPAFEDSGAQVAALTNSITLGSRINWDQRFGFSRQKVYSTFKPELTNSTFGIGFPGGNGLPGVSLGAFSYSSGGAVTLGPNSTFANAGYFQNRWNPGTNLIFSIGKHNLTAGTTYSYTQLNVRNRRVNQGSLSTSNFVTFVEGQVKAGSSTNEVIGNANRYYRANEIGSYIQDQWRLLPNLSITAGIRYDYDGGFTEKYGNFFNFDPSLYSATQTAVSNSGFVVAGNNHFSPTAGVSNSTLTGRQWGISPRLGFAFTPANNGGKVVFRGSVGTYYDRGELFSYLSQPAGSSTGGPFGVTEAPPLVNYVTASGSPTLENPLGSTVIPVSSSDPSTFTSKIVTANAIRAGCGGLTVEQTESNGDCGVSPYNFGSYARDNKLPYAISFAFNVQAQLAKDLSLLVGYAGNRGRHGVIPVPFNEPGIATPTNPINGETSSYGYEVLNTASTTGKYYNPISTEPYDTYDGGNIDLRVPYIGYSPNAALFRAAGVSAYDSLQVQLVKQLNHYISANVSYTWGHALDEQSDIGLFFTGDNPNRLRDSYASADFDRTNVLVFNYVFQLPKLVSDSRLVGRFTNGWQLVGITTLQSGQPYSLYEYDGAVGSLYFGNYPTLANPVLGIKNGANPRSAFTGAPGTQLNYANGAVSSSTPYIPLLDNNQLQVNFVNPGVKGVPNCTGFEPCDVFENDFTPGQRNIFRQSFQKDADMSLQKITRINDRFSTRYTFDIYNVTNSTSFDVPNNSASVSQSKLTLATGGTAVAYGQVATSTATQSTDVGRLYVTRANGSTTFGAIRNTIGQPRTIEMSLHLLF